MISIIELSAAKGNKSGVNKLKHEHLGTFKPINVFF